MSFASETTVWPLPVRTPPLNLSVGPAGPPAAALGDELGLVDAIFNSTDGRKSFLGLPGPRRSAAAEGFPLPTPNRCWGWCPTTSGRMVTGRTVGATVCRGVTCCSGDSSSGSSSIGEDCRQELGVVLGSRIASTRGTGHRFRGGLEGIEQYRGCWCCWCWFCRVGR